MSTKLYIATAALGTAVALGGLGAAIFGGTEPLSGAMDAPLPLVLPATTRPRSVETTLPLRTAPTTAPVATIGEQIEQGTVFVARSLLEEGLVSVWGEPDDRGEPAWQLSVPTEFFGPRYFAVIGEQGDYFEIMVPVRPNGSTGWIPKDDVSVSVVDSSITVDLSDHELTAFVDGEEVFSMGVAIGRPDHPTPVGDWFLRDELPWDADSVYGPYVLALNAYSDTILQINGGDAVVALHGTSRPDLIGGDVSLGCVRIENSDITALAEIVEPGTPVHIVE